MKTSSLPLPPLDLTALARSTVKPIAPADFIPTRPTDNTVRILLSLEVPASTRAAIEADWNLVAIAQAQAPDLAATAVGAAFVRLHQHAVRVSGVAFAEAVQSPFAPWLRRAA